MLETLTQFPNKARMERRRNQIAESTHSSATTTVQSSSSCLLRSSSVNMESNEMLQFYVHDELHSVRASDIPPETTLNEYLRKTLGLTGTKVMCREGGCGVCVVGVIFKHPVTQKEVTLAINSCLVPLFLCSGWKILTIEGIGSRLKGYHPIQKKLADFNGTQCGFCSSGMVMNMYSLYLDNAEKVTTEQVENSFGGNMCRCTGYRPILSAFKSMASDANEKYTGVVPDIEDCLAKLPCLAVKYAAPEPNDFESTFAYKVGETQWYKVDSIDGLLQIIKQNPRKAIQYHGGCTAHGVYPDMEGADISVDINMVKDLKTAEMNTREVVLGANMSLTDFMSFCEKSAANDRNFAYLKQVKDHVDLIAHVPVRNIGTLAGNLMIKYNHNEFQSDIFLLLETVNATLVIIDTNKHESAMSPSEFLHFDMHNKVIKQIKLPALDSNQKFGSYKIMPRAQNAHAIVNAGFLVTLKSDGTISKATIVYGAINPKFVHATSTEKYLVGKKLFTDATLQGALETLKIELDPDYVLPDPKPEFRKQLALALFYKFVLSIAPNVNEKYKSGGTVLKRPISKGVQDYKTDKSLYPLSEPIRKLEAIAQTTGEAEYIMDKHLSPKEVYARFVLAKARANSEILKIDASRALKLRGVLGFYSAKDIPGKNSFTPIETSYPNDEEIFAEKTVKFYYQPIGLVVAESQAIADKAVELVDVTYKISPSEPMLTIQDILKAKPKDRLIPYQIFPAKSKGTDIKHVIKGKLNLYWQYHYTMETQCASAMPYENDEYTLYPSTQWMDLAQISGATCLKIKESKIDVEVRRLGGAYGAKISRNNLVSCAAIIAAHKLKKPVKLWMPLTDNMNVVGKRNPFYVEYEAGVNDKGVTQYVNMTTYTDVGFANNEAPVAMIIDTINQAYNSDVFELDVNITRTENHSATWTRSPGSVEGHCLIESIMEHVAHELKLDPYDVRMANLDSKNHTLLQKYMTEFTQWADITKRKADIETFNKSNRWRKKGISVVPLAYHVMFEGIFTGQIAIYRGDGSVIISHGGIEMGQGINTKAAQTVAAFLGISMDLITVKPSNILASPNSYVTGGSIGSETICYGLKKCCEDLNKRMEPTKKEMGGNPAWVDLVQKCYGSGVNLTSHYIQVNTNPDMNYMVYGVVATEVEVDLLTGNYIPTRVDLLEDTGLSMSPLIDIGQVEGAFIMSLGYHTSEEIIMDSKTGELKTNRTWTYKPPGAKDIPVEFNVKFPSEPNPKSPFKTKATAEPPFLLGFSVSLAIRQALNSARMDSNPEKAGFLETDGPYTVEKTFMDALPDSKQYKLN